MTSTARRVGRNDPCHCGSGKKYKKCHGPKDTQMPMRQRVTWILLGTALVGTLVMAILSRQDRAQPTGVWSAEHGHYH